MKKKARDFSWELDQWFQNNVAPDGGGLEWARQVMLDLISEVVDRTPVKTGRARGSWLVAIGGGKPRLRTVPDKVGSQTVFAAGRVLMSLNQIGEPVQFYSHQPYMGRLETGSSLQAPSGMLTGAIAAVLARHGGRATA